jgi:malate dehydrogenase
MFGADQPVILHLIEIKPMMPKLGGTIMELDDCAFPLLHGVVPTDDLEEGFRGASWAFLVGSIPRKPGMERKDLLSVNGRIFVEQGKVLQKVAASDVRVLAVGNPCNTNCLIAMHHAPDIPANRWFAMTRLDENRARNQLAKRAAVPVAEVTNMTIWGNHSPTQYPDFYNARIRGQPAHQVIGDEAWLKDHYIPFVQQRGATVLKARGSSSAASAAKAISDTVHSLTKPSVDSNWHSVALCSDGSYGIEPGLICSFPVRCNGQRLEIVQDLSINEFSRAKIDLSIRELKEERAMVLEMFPR